MYKASSESQSHMDSSFLKGNLNHPIQFWQLCFPPTRFSHISRRVLPWLLWPLRILPAAQIPPIAEGNALVLASPSLVTVRDDTAGTVDRSHFFFFWLCWSFVLCLYHQCWLHHHLCHLSHQCSHFFPELMDAFLILILRNKWKFQITTIPRRVWAWIL